MFTVPQLIRLGQAVNACYDENFLSNPDRVAVPSNAVTVVYGTDPDGRKPYGVIYFDDNLASWVCAIRGTEGWTEWVDDFEFMLVDSGIVHNGRSEHGFTSIYRTLEAGGEPLRQFMSKQLGPIVITGHSLGAALATMTAVDLQVALVTFASPRVGDDIFANVAEELLKNHVRVVNEPDLVPDVPARLLPLFPYAHIGLPLLVDSTGKMPEDAGTWHSLDTYLKLLGEQIPA